MWVFLFSFLLMRLFKYFSNEEFDIRNVCIYCPQQGMSWRRQPKFCTDKKYRGNLAKTARTREKKKTKCNPSGLVQQNTHGGSLWPENNVLPLVQLVSGQIVEWQHSPQVSQELKSKKEAKPPVFSWKQLFSSVHLGQCRLFYSLECYYIIWPDQLI